MPRLCLWNKPDTVGAIGVAGRVPEEGRDQDQCPRYADRKRLYRTHAAYRKENTTNRWLTTR
jgi:hypothetical protein